MQSDEKERSRSILDFSSMIWKITKLLNPNPSYSSKQHQILSEEAQTLPH
jgi:hypothetical protein